MYKPGFFHPLTPMMACLQMMKEEVPQLFLIALNYCLNILSLLINFNNISSDLKINKRRSLEAIKTDPQRSFFLTRSLFLTSKHFIYIVFLDAMFAECIVNTYCSIPRYFAQTNMVCCVQRLLTNRTILH